MRTSITRTSITLLIVLVLLPTVCAAQLGGPENYLTLKEIPESTAYDFGCTREVDGTVVTLDLNLFNPVNHDFDGGQTRAVTGVNGFECRLVHTEGMEILAWHFPVQAIDVGSGDEVKVGFAEPVPVVDGKATVATIDVFFGNASFELFPYDYGRCVWDQNILAYIKPTFMQSLPGVTAYLDADDPDDPLVPGFTTGDDADHVYSLRLAPVATERNTWGTLKSFYR